MIPRFNRFLGDKLLGKIVIKLMPLHTIDHVFLFILLRNDENPGGSEIPIDILQAEWYNVTESTQIENSGNFPAPGIEERSMKSTLGEAPHRGARLKGINAEGGRPAAGRLLAAGRRALRLSSWL